MKMTFEGKTLADVIASIGDFLKDYTSQSNIIARAVDDTGDYVGETTSSPEPTRRKRRTKAEMKAAKADATLDTSAKATTEPTTRRRRRGSAQTTQASAGTVAPARRRRGSVASPSSDIKDADLVKGASTLAQATNPSVVKTLLEEFGATKVQELEGDARREFLMAATEMAEDE